MARQILDLASIQTPSTTPQSQLHAPTLQYSKDPLSATDQSGFMHTSPLHEAPAGMLVPEGWTEWFNHLEIPAIPVLDQYHISTNEVLQPAPYVWDPLLNIPSHPGLYQEYPTDTPSWPEQPLSWHAMGPLKPTNSHLSGWEYPAYSSMIPNAEEDNANNPASLQQPLLDPDLGTFADQLTLFDGSLNDQTIATYL
jgi:hypothetical protein